MKRLLLFGEKLAQEFGRPLQRIPIDLGLGCPNRNADGSGGCAFCGEDGGRARHLAPGQDIASQVGRGLEYVQRRYKSEAPYIAYFQSFTNTYADVATLERLYTQALSLADFKIAIVGTRPDCLPEETLDLLSEINSRIQLWVELGVQTANEKTLSLIGRGHGFHSVESAVKSLSDRGIKTAAHVILGLPGETQKDFNETAIRLAGLPFSGIKAHNLLVIKGTKMERMLAEGLVKPMDECEYAAALAEFLEILPETWTIMRLSAEAPAKQLVAPKWWMKKGQFLDFFKRSFEARSENAPLPLPSVRTEDGSYTIYHPQYRQHFHSMAGAWEESFKKYLEPCRLKERLEEGEDLRILDVGFGLGFNACAAASIAESVRKGKLKILSLESDRQSLKAALELPVHPSPEIIGALAREGSWQGERASIEILWGDARATVSSMKDRFDLILLDAFSTESNPELWSLDFIRALKSRMRKNSLLASYSSAFPFRGALIRSGFLIFESRPFGRRRGGTIASMDAYPWLPPMTSKERAIATKSTAGAPYRDPALSWTRDKILSFRKSLVSKLRAKGVPKWYK